MIGLICRIQKWPEEGLRDADRRGADLLLPTPSSTLLCFVVAKLVKSFGHLGNAAESLDDFRYAKACQRTFWELSLKAYR